MFLFWCTHIAISVSVNHDDGFWCTHIAKSVSVNYGDGFWCTHIGLSVSVNSDDGFWCTHVALSVSVNYDGGSLLDTTAYSCPTQLTLGNGPNFKIPRGVVYLRISQCSQLQYINVDVSIKRFPRTDTLLSVYAILKGRFRSSQIFF